MKKVKLIAVILMCILLALSLSACVIKHIDDTNGDDDFSVVTIGDADILNGPSNSLSYLRITTRINNTCTVKVDKFSGIDQLEKIVVSSGSKTITIELIVTSGNCRLVLTNNREIVYDFSINGTDSYTLESGTYRLKLVGESAEISMLKYSITSA